MSAELMTFWPVAALTLGCGIGVVVMRKAVYSALCLAATMILLAILYVAQGAVFLAVVQVVVYTGAVMMLFLFVLMLIGIDSSDSLVETLRGQRVTTTVAALGAAVLLCVAIGNVTVVAVAPPPAENNVQGLAALIFVRYVWAFELTSALLITAALGAMVLAHRERFEHRKTQRELAQDRFRPGAHPTTLPSSGVYARHNAVDVPARLPDGSAAVISVSSILVPRSLEEGRQ